jgi:2-methylcitrate dehydratase PrpD
MNNNVTDTFINSIYSIKNENIPESAVKKVKECLLDYIGVTIAGAKMQENKNDDLLTLTGIEESHSTIIGQNKKTSLLQAAFINGLNSHIAELDDGVISGIIHPGAPVFSALLPVAEKENVTFNEFCYGVLIGYESSVRLANAIQPSHKKRGYHATATCGSIGVAMGIAAMLNFSKSEMKNALSAAAVSAHGSLKVLEDASELKPFNTGSAALNGIIAAFVSKSGFKGPDDVFSGNAGFFRQVSDSVNYSKLNKNNQFCIENVYFKPYAACRYCHPSIEASFKIRKHPQFFIENIEKIEISTYSLAVENHDHIKIYNVSSAKMSIPYSVSVALLLGHANVEAYTDIYINNPMVSSLMGKTIVTADESLSKMFPEKCVSIVQITMKDGILIQEEVDSSKGDPENPLSEKELIDKFYSLWNFAEKSQEKGKHIIEILQSNQVDLKELILLLK